MPVPAPLRLVVSRAENAPPLDSTLAWRPAPPHGPSRTETTFLIAAATTLAVHAAVLAWMAIVPADDAARSAGAAADLILLEGIPVEMVTSMPAPEAPPAEAAPETPPTAEEPPPEPPEEPPAEPVTEPPPIPPQPETAAEPPPADTTLPAAEAETGELPARPDEPPSAAESPPDEPPPPEDVPSAEEPPPEAPPPVEDTTDTEPPPPDPATVPTPRAKPERTEVAEPEPEKPAAPPPSAPSAPASAARSGGAGGGGAAQTAGNATASAYRAEVAARLAKKRFYPNAARRDRLTGRATVSFTLNASGRVTAARIVRSAGARVLDEAALEMVRRAAPYPPIPSGLGATITIQAPIGFELPR